MLQYLLDTNIVVYTMKNRPAKVRDRFMLHDGRMAISSVTLGELVYGAERSSQPDRNLKDIESLLSRIEVLQFDDVAAFHFCQLRADLYNRGLPIRPYDMMIAGHARSRGLILVTNYVAEFERVPGLRIEKWV